MYPSRHFSISEENGFQFPGSRIPKIPISTIAAGLQEVSGDSVSGVPGTLNSLRSPGFVGELFQQDPTSNAMAAYTNSNDSIDQNRGFNNCTAGFVGINSYDHITASEALEVPGSAIQWGPSCTAAAGSTLATSYSWTNGSVQQSTADSSNIIQNGSYAGSSTCYPSSLPQTNQQPIAVPTLLSNKSISEILNTWNNKPASTPNYGFPTPQNTNLNSRLGLAVQQEPGERYRLIQPQPVPEPPVESISCMRPTQFPWNTIINALADKPNSFHLAQLTPDPSKRMQNQVHETDEECEARELLKNGKQLDIATGIITKAIQSSTVMNSITGLSAFTEEHGNSDREDTQTPQWKKPIRKRHRPKVVTDGKPKRTPKPTTPNEEMTKRSSRKRHCVTEGTGTTENTPLHIASEAAYTTAKRSKRALNFDLEDGQGKKQNLSSASLQHMTPDKGIQYSRRQYTNFSSQSYNQVLTNTSSGSNSSLQQQANGAEITVETLTGILPFDLNLSPIAAVSDEILLPEKHAPIIRSPAIEELIKDELNSNVKIRNIVNHPNALLDGKEDDSSKGQGVQATGVGTIKFAPQNCLQSTTTRQNELSSSSNVIPMDNKQAKEIQRGYRSMDTMTRLIGYHFYSLKSYQEMLQKNEVHRDSSMHFQEIHKKDGTKEYQNNVKSLNPYLITMENNTERESACKQPSATANFSMTQPNSGESIPSSSNSNDPTNRINRAGNSPVSKYPIMAIGNSLEEQDTSAELPSQTILTEGTLKTPKSPEFMPTFSKIGRKTGKISKVTRVHDFANLITIAEDKQLLPTPSKTTSTPSTEQGPKIIQGAQTCMEVLAMNSHTKAVKELSKKRAPPQGSMLNESTNELFPSEQDAALSKYSQNTIKSIGLSERTDTNVAPHDENSKQLDYNSISDISTQNYLKDLQVLVPFVKASTVVPYEGAFDPISKQHQRPKVVLDQETERVWKLLMQNASSEDVEDTEDKRKWWEEERRVFHGRADSFIARMHLIQGDRRFSKWKGSIVDSVVGVFLTQNVSDHLSSSAFMALAAQFPHQPTGHTTRPEARTTICIKKQEVSVTRSDKHDCVIKKANMSGEADAIKGSITEQIEDGEMAKSKGSSPTNIESGIIADNLKEKHLAVSRNGKDPWHGSLENKTHSLSMQIERPNSFEAQTCDLLEENFSSQNAASSSHNSYYESRDLITVKKLDIFENSTFMELLYMADSTVLREYYKDGNGGFNHNHVDSQARGMEAKRWPLNMDGIHWPKEDILPNSQSTNFHSHFTQAPTIPSSKFGLQMVNPESEAVEAETSLQMVNPESEAVEAELPVIFGEESRYFLQSNGTEIKEPQDRHHITKKFRTMTETSVSSKVKNKSISSCEDIQRNKSIQNKVVKSNSREQLYISAKLPNVTASRSLKKKKKSGSETNEPVDWDYLRKEVHPNGLTSKRNNNAMDSVNWEAVRHANVEEIATVIKERGLNNMLAARIKDFLNRLVREHGHLDLEWLRDVSPDKAKEYLLSIRGLGLKSVECVRLLTLQHVAFPVDTNVARIAVRLGWVPLQPLPESLQLHLLELYPVLESIQKYLWPRLCTLDQRTLYELHYQMITFGKVFCTKRQPNCNACPMKAECRHFASAFASARLALPGPEERRMVSLTGPANADYWPDVGIGPIKLSFQEIDMGTRRRVNKCEPIIEEPASPENQQTESDLEDAFYEDQNEIPTIRLNIEEFTSNLQNYIQEQNGEFQEGDMSKAIVALNPAEAAIPMPKLKNVSRLRTEHQVYELPDSHPLLREEQLDRREPDDPCPYLLAIWAPGETAESTSPPERHCHSQESGNLCDKKTCFSCNSIREADCHMVRGTILIPSKTAMRGSFPLNGTYFQVNEVFADHDSSLHPIQVNRNWVWNLPRRTVFFGTSIPTIFRGLSTEEIQRCFWRGFVCIRGFDTKTRAPRPLTPRFHLPASKVTKTKTKRNIK